MHESMNQIFVSVEVKVESGNQCCGSGSEGSSSFWCKLYQRSMRKNKNATVKGCFYDPCRTKTLFRAKLPPVHSTVGTNIVAYWVLHVATALSTHSIAYASQVIRITVLWIPIQYPPISLYRIVWSQFDQVLGPIISLMNSL